MRRVVDEQTLRSWIRSSRDALAEARSELDDLNVFPVPDGDTGTNLFLTLEAACEAADECPAGCGLADISAAIASGALLGARGNSGVIMSQLLRAACEVVGALPEGHEFDPDVIRAVLRRGEVLAYKAVARPVEGTILTVARAAADSAEAADGDLISVLSAAVAGARVALAATTDQLESLRRAGVVDAGGRGLVVVLEALDEVVSGVRRTAPRSEPAGHRQPAARGAADGGSERYTGPAYEVMYLLDAEESSVDALRSRLGDLGDSLVVVGGGGLWNVHVHVDDAGAAIEAALLAGRPHRIRVTYLESEPHGPAGLRGARRLVVVTHGPGTASLLESAGAAVVAAEPGRRPSTAEVLAGIRAAGSAEVIVLPSDRDSRPSAEVAAEQARGDGIRVSVIPTRSIVQSLAAAAVHDPLATFDDDVVSMTRAAGATHYGAVTVATKEALTSGGVCRPGDILGLVGGDIVEVGSDLREVTMRVLGRLLSTGGEMVTLVSGLGTDPLLVEELVGDLHRLDPALEIQAIDGGQPLWPLIVGVE